MKFQAALAQLLAGKDLSENQSQAILEQLFRGEINLVQAKALLLVLAQKGETSGEIAGCLKALRRFEPPFASGISNLVDTAGTGGDKSGSINVSTLAAFVIAGAGGKVAKHGNRGISSKCGSSDLMEAFGVNLSASRSKMITAIKKCGIGYFHAPFHHPTFSRVQDLRKSLKTKTIFNYLGPLTNPLELKAQLVGVSSRNSLELYAAILKDSKTRNALVCHSEDGLDEISVGAKTNLCWIKKGKIQKEKLDPKKLGFKSSEGNVQGGDVKKNKRLGLELLKGKLKGPLGAIVILNAAAGLVVSGAAKNFQEGIKKANESVDSGKAYQALLGLIKISNS